MLWRSSSILEIGINPILKTSLAVLPLVASMAAPGMPSLTLGTTTIPALGFGTGTTWFKGAQGEDALIASLQAALDMGVRHIDEAEMYANEEVRTHTTRRFVDRVVGWMDAGVCCWVGWW